MNHTRYRGRCGRILIRECDRVLLDAATGPASNRSLDMANICGAGLIRERARHSARYRFVIATSLREQFRSRKRRNEPVLTCARTIVGAEAHGMTLF